MVNQEVEPQIVEQIVEDVLKHCKGCNTDKALDQFSKQKTKLRSQCKSCVSIYAKANYKLKRQKYHVDKYIPRGRPRGRPKKIVPIVEEIDVN